MSLLVLNLLTVLTPRPAFLPILIPEALLILLIFSPGSQAFYLLQIMRTFSFTSAWYFLGPWLEPLASNTGVWCHIWVSLHRSSKGQAGPSVNGGNSHGWSWLLEKSTEMCHAEPLSEVKDHPQSHWECRWKQDLSSQFPAILAEGDAPSQTGYIQWLLFTEIWEPGLFPLQDSDLPAGWAETFIQTRL